jgi:vanillate O-demethylase ferredoxin subunit
MSGPHLDVRVARRTVEATDICSYELVAVDGKPLPSFSAGSHIDVYLPNGLIRQYSLCNDPAAAHHYLIGVLRDPVSRGGSQAMHDQVREGDTLRISVPRNHFPLAHEASHHLLLAGGIGVTPILCMAERLAMIGASFELHYCTRSPDRTAFRDRIAASSFNDRVHFHHDDGPPAQLLNIPEIVAWPKAGLHLYVCGPKGFMDAVLGAARAKGWNSETLHFEFFTADVSPKGDEAEFQVRLASSGQIVDVPADKSVVQALADAGVEVLVSCEQGVCGTCLTRVLEGEPEHRDSYLTPEEQAANDQFTPCCSRSRSGMLVLDL